MARGRMISKSLSTSQRFADLGCRAGALGEFCQSLYPLIVAHADDFGRLQGDPFTVKHQCHPTSPRSIDEFTSALRILHEVGLIQWFTVNHGSCGGGRHYIQVVNFEAHQQGLHKRTRSAFPRVPDDSGNIPTDLEVELFPEVPGQLKGTKENLTKENRNKDLDRRYATFASEYPAERRVGGLKAKTSYRKTYDDQPDLDAHEQRMLTALRQHKRSRQWNGLEPKIPLLTTWLNQERWNQVLPEDRTAHQSARVHGCRHHPACVDSAACTKLRLAESRGAA